MCGSLPPWADRDEILGAVHEELWRAILRYDRAHGVKPQTYLLTRVHGAVLDCIRRWGRDLDEHGELPASLDFALDDTGYQGNNEVATLGDLVPDPCAIDPQEAAERAESDARVAAAIARLSGPVASDVVACLVGSQPLSDRARATGRGPSAVSANCRTGRRALALALAGRPAPDRLPALPQPCGPGRAPYGRAAAS